MLNDLAVTNEIYTFAPEIDKQYIIIMFEKGQEVYVAPHRDTRLKPYNGVVKSIGKKYITVTTKWGIEKFDLESLLNINWSAYQLFESEEDYRKKVDMKKKVMLINQNIRKILSKLSDEEIDRLYNLI